jgi:hypothetical protein
VRFDAESRVTESALNGGILPLPKFESGDGLRGAGGAHAPNAMVKQPQASARTCDPPFIGDIVI